jgi:hypothetical protein
MPGAADALEVGRFQDHVTDVVAPNHDSREYRRARHARAGRGAGYLAQ